MLRLWFVFQGRLKPGRMLLVDTKEKVFLKDEDIKAKLAHLRPYGKWLAEEVSCLLVRQACWSGGSFILK